MFTAHSTFSSCRCLLVVNLYSGEQTTTYNSFTAERPCSVFFFGAASNLVTRLVITPTKKKKSNSGGVSHLAAFCGTNENQ